MCILPLSPSIGFLPSLDAALRHFPTAARCHHPADARMMREAIAIHAIDAPEVWTLGRDLTQCQHAARAREALDETFARFRASWN